MIAADHPEGERFSRKRRAAPALGSPCAPTLRRVLLGCSAALVAALLPLPAAAQYQWLDERNQMVFSDVAPPPSVPLERILRIPEPKPVAVPAAAAAGAAAPRSTSTEAPAPTIVDREMAYRTRQLAQAAAARKAAAENGRKAELAGACNDARDSVRMLESGMRVTRVAANGEREFLSDAERRSRLDAARRNIAAHCG